MKRDMDLVRKLLLQIEELDKGYDDELVIEPSVDPPLFEGHMRLLKEAGLIEAEEFPDGDTELTFHYPTRLTWAGHEFLDSVRDEEIWANTKAGAQQVGGFSLDLLKAVAKGLLKKKLEQYTGVEIDF